MTVKTAYEQGMSVGMWKVAQAFAERYGIEPEALYQDMIKTAQDENLITGTDVGLGLGAAGLGGGGAAIERFAPGAYTGALENLAAAEKGVATEAARKALDGNTKMQQNVLSNLKAQGGGPRFSRATDLAAKATSMGQSTGIAELDDALAAARKSNAGNLAGANKATATARNMGITSKGLGTLGRGMKNLGALGGIGLLGKKIYDVATD